MEFVDMFTMRKYGFCIKKTTMFVKGHWKTLKRDFLYKFFHPRMDLVTFILMKNVVIHQKRKFQQINLGREKPDWIKDFII